MLRAICQSKKLASLKTDGARLLYTWLLPNVDINGCFSGDPEVIKGQIFTRLKKSTKTILGYIEELDSAGLIIWYQSNGDHFLHIPDFVDKQPSLNPDREAKPTIPMPTPDQLEMKSCVTPLKVKESKDKVKKSKHKDNIFLFPEEYLKLSGKLGAEKLESLMEDLNNYIGSSGKRYKSHYFTLLAWSRRKKEEGANSGKAKLFPISGKTCSKRDCPFPAVYKSTGGAYDHWYCTEHLPDKVKEKYE